MYSPWGYEWLRDRLLAAGRTNPVVFSDPNDPERVVLQIAEANVSKNQLAFECSPPLGSLAANATQINVPPMTTKMVAITGPAGSVVRVRFDGVGFVSETEFTIPDNNNYEFQLGPCPAGQRVVTPQMLDFYVEDGSCSPVAVAVTFK